MKILLCLSLLSISSFPFAQEGPKKFGDVNAEEIQRKIYSIDSSANAVVLFDEAYSSFLGGGSITFYHHKRVHILRAAGRGEANIEVPIYGKGNSDEEFYGVKAATYNLEDGKIIVSNFDKKDLFTENSDEDHKIKKFALPNVKEGSIIEYEYKVTSYFYNLDSWEFQGSNPCLWSEYKLFVPSYLQYVFTMQGFHTLFIDDHKDVGNGTDNHWAMKNIPGLKEENYSSSPKNYIARLDFRLASVGIMFPTRLVNTWPEFTKLLLNNEKFGLPLSSSNRWLSELVDPVIKSVNTEDEKARALFAYVRDNFSCISHNGRFLSKSLRQVAKERKGTAADINLLLVAIFRYADLKADPVLVSTRKHGFMPLFYPSASFYNYVLCKASFEGKAVYLDASYPVIGFGKLPNDCYNGLVIVVNEEATHTTLFTDSLTERKNTRIVLNNNDNGEWIGSYAQTEGNNESFELRQRFKLKGRDSLLEKLRQNTAIMATMLNVGIDSLTNYDKPISVHFDFVPSVNKESVIYVNPMFGHEIKSNPFKSEERLYPVEMPYGINDVFSLTMEIPQGYVVDELPQPVKIKLDENNSGVFQYLISQSKGYVSLRSEIKLTKTYFTTEEYELLRTFFQLIMKKQSEQIVFKKQ